MTDEYWFRCPSCLTLGVIDDDQVNGRVSIMCDCGYHETVTVRPRIHSTEAVRRNVVFDLRPAP
jgi:acetyl-CoA carboxylase beta subunit